MSECKFNYDESLQSSIEYFDGDELAAKVFLDKYALRNERSDEGGHESP